MFLDHIEKKEDKSLIVLAHLSVKECLMSVRILSSLAYVFHLPSKIVNTAIAKSCLAYIQQFIQSWSKKDPSNKKVSSHTFLPSLLSYVLQSLPEHVSESHHNDETLNTAVVNFLGRDSFAPKMLPCIGESLTRGKCPREYYGQSRIVL
ncbi:hypothetical protein P154DRAFT_335719 [Amniculicola lignicola CBS 123094]|uniref:Uncharacterized protein n=1 Tax=Amniculicola lignicola CBS 123094 TaxID=1392246 RepID=A0A6A5W1Z5_9PLEO|nr:hypothetical protein P154DRAFT_335719 [Amniculicola lignicola CBS 123094]